MPIVHQYDAAAHKRYSIAALLTPHKTPPERLILLFKKDIIA